MTEFFLAERMARLGGESAFQVLDRAKKLEEKGMDIIHLEIGQPDFETPNHIIEAAYQAMKNGMTGYTPAQGLMETRQAIASYCKKYKGVDTIPEEIVVVPGGKPIMFFVILSLIGPGDEVIYPDPGFAIYSSCVSFSGGKGIPLPMRQEKDFKADPEELKKLISEKTKLIILNSPGNPTGGVLEKKDAEALADVIKPTKAFVLSDEIYDRLVFGETKPYSIAAVDGMKDRTIILDGFSKAYAMTGWRLGYGVMNRALAKAVTDLMVNSNSCAASFTQIAAIAALEGQQECVERMKGAYEKRLTYFTGELNKIKGFHCLMPKGSFYAFPSIAEFGIEDTVFAQRLLEEGGVACLAGSTFGRYGASHLRFSAATSMENLTKAIERMRVFTEKLERERRTINSF